LRAQALYAEAFVAETLDRQPEVALEINERLLETYRRDLGVHPKTAQSLFNVAASRSDMGRYAEAKPLLEEALAMYESIGGPRSRDTAVAQYGLGTCLLDLGELDRSTELLSTAATSLEDQSFTFWVGLTLAELSRARLLQGRVAEAVATAERSLRAVPAEARVSPEASVVEGDGLNRLGRFAEARPLCAQATTLMQGAGLMDPAKPYPDDSLRCEAEALLGLGRAAEAVPLLERSLGFSRRGHVADYARAEIAMARLLRSLHEEPERVRSLAIAARDELARYPYLAAEMGRAEAFVKELQSGGK
jgi:tetratricopeptide (TPR) repeat protein